MQSQLQAAELQAAVGSDEDDLAVHDAARRERVGERRHEFGEEAFEAAAVAALDVHAVAVANTSARNPSHFGSYSQPSPRGISRWSFASMGSTGGSNGNEVMVAPGSTSAVRPRMAGRPSPMR
jgi:hypothetical protein